jgi:hypothetical protein
MEALVPTKQHDRDHVRTSQSHSSNPFVRAFDWLFRNPETGEIVIAQMPNLPLFLFIFAAAVKRFAHPHGAFGTIVGITAVVSLLWWAVDEVVRGESNFRRILGAVVAVATVAGLFLR